MPDPDGKARSRRFIVSEARLSLRVVSITRTSDHCIAKAIVLKAMMDHGSL